MIRRKDSLVSHGTRRWEQQIARAGYRVTRQRALVLDAVCAGQGHTTLSEVSGRVMREDRTISRSTVYRALHMFVDAGVVVLADTGDAEPYYEIAHEAPHHHLRCRQCGWEQEIAADDLSGVEVAVRDRYGFQINTDHLVLFGLCHSCQTGPSRPVATASQSL